MAITSHSYASKSFNRLNKNGWVRDDSLLQPTWNRYDHNGYLCAVLTARRGDGWIAQYSQGTENTEKVLQGDRESAQAFVDAILAMEG